MFSLDSKHADPISFERPLMSFITNYYKLPPEKFSTDIISLEKLRTDAISALDATLTSIQILSSYYCTLVEIESKFNIKHSGIKIGFSWYNSMPKDKRIGTFTTFILVSSNSIDFEKAAILFNCAIIYYKMAQNQIASLSEDKFKMACSYFSTAAGIFKFISETCSREYSVPDSCDLSMRSLTGLHKLMLSLAQECFYKKALQESSTLVLLAKLAVSTADYYESAYEDLTIPPLDSSYGCIFTDRIRAKSLFHYSLSHSFKAQKLNEACIYGEEIARLALAVELIKKTTTSLKSLTIDFEEEVTSHGHRFGAALQAATKDNNMIYHEKVPDQRTLPHLYRASLASPKLPPFLEFNHSENSIKLFESLIPYNIKLASDAYNKKKDFIVSSMSKEASDHEEFVKAELNLSEYLRSTNNIDGHSLQRKQLESISFDLKQKNCVLEFEKATTLIASLISSSFENIQKVKNLLAQEEIEDGNLQKKYRNSWTRHSSSFLSSAFISQLGAIFSTLKELELSVTETRQTFERILPNLNLLSSRELFSKSPQVGNNQTNGALKSQVQYLIMEIATLQEERKNIILNMRNISTEDDITSSLLKLCSVSENYLKEQEELYEKFLDKYSSFPSMLFFVSNKINALLLQLKTLSNISINHETSSAQKENVLVSNYYEYQKLSKRISEIKEICEELQQRLVGIENEAKDFIYSRNLEASELERSILEGDKKSPAKSPQKESKEILSQSKDIPELKTVPPKAYHINFSPGNQTSNRKLEIVNSDNFELDSNVPSPTSTIKGWDPSMPICYAISGKGSSDSACTSKSIHPSEMPPPPKT